MPNIQDAFPSKFLKASDLHGKEPVVTIDRVEYEAVGRERQMKPVLYFRGKEKGMVLNKTNANKITQLLASGITEEWQGRAIRLYCAEVQFGDETMEGIRVKAAPPNGRHAAPPPPPPPPPEDTTFDGPLTDDDIPF